MSRRYCFVLFGMGCVAPSPDAQVAIADGPFFATVGEPLEIPLASGEGVSFSWSVADEPAAVLETPEPFTVTFDRPGHLRLTVEAVDERGRSAQDQAMIYVTYPPAPERPISAGSIALNEDQVFVTLPDFDRIAVVTGSAVSHLETCDHPSTLSVNWPWLAVACSGDDQLHRIQLETGDESFVTLDWGSRPYGVLVFGDGRVVSTLQGTGEVVQWDPETDQLEEVSVGSDLRGLAGVGDDLLVSRHRSPAEGGVWYRLQEGAVASATLAWDPGPDSDGDARGLPTYLQHIAVRPDGLAAGFSGLKANVERGLYNEGRAFTDESTVRADFRQVSLVPSEWGTEGTALTLDNRDRVAAAAYHPTGHLLVVVTAGSQSLEVVDPYSMRVLDGALEVGHGVRGVAIDEAGQIWVDAELSRELVRYRLDGVELSGESQRIPLTDGLEEPLEPDILAGKKLFYDASDRRLTAQGYVACASCHLDGEPDGLTWDFTDRGEGLRNTPTLLGVSGSGLLHWSANFDEVQDFEHAIRDAQAGAGLMPDEVFATCDTTLGSPKAGLSEPLDQLAAYVNSLTPELRSPYRNVDGTWTTAGLAGQTVFDSETARCSVCHTAPTYTDSGWGEDGQPVLHDVGSLEEASGQRLGEEMTGLDTPSLWTLHATAPYGHLGRAETLADLWLADGGLHGGVDQLSDSDLSNLLRFLLELEAPSN